MKKPAISKHRSLSALDVSGPKPVEAPHSTSGGQARRGAHPRSTSFVPDSYCALGGLPFLGDSSDSEMVLDHQVGPSMRVDERKWSYGSGSSSASGAGMGLANGDARERCHDDLGGASKVEDESAEVVDDVVIVFQVEGRIYKVSRALLTHNSPLFADLFQLSQHATEDDVLEGLSEEQPVVLEGITEMEWNALLSCLYDLKPVFSVPQRLSLLRISHRFQFPTIFSQTLHDLVSPSLNLIPAIDRLLLLEQYSLDLSEPELKSLQDPCIQEVARRGTTLTQDEMARLPWSVVYQIRLIESGANGFFMLGDIANFEDLPVHGFVLPEGRGGKSGKKCTRGAGGGWRWEEPAPGTGGIGWPVYVPPPPPQGGRVPRHSLTRDDGAAKPYLKNSPKDKAKRVLRDVGLSVMGRKFSLGCISGRSSGPRAGMGRPRAGSL